MAEQNQNLSLTLISPEDLAGQDDDTVFDGAPETDAWLKLEQEEDFIGYPTENSPCTNHVLVLALRVFRSDPELEYVLDLSYGTLSPEVLAVEEEAEESHFINLDTELDISDAGAGNLLWARWEGTVRDSNGDVVANPPTYGQQGIAPYVRGGFGAPIVPQVSGMSYVDGVLAWPEKLHGSLRVRYLAAYDRWLVTLTPRDGANPYKPEAYESMASAFYAGRAENLELTADFDCGGSDDDEDEDDEEEGDCYDLHIKYHMCTGEEISRELVPVPCPPEEDEAATDPEGT